ncbi:hypothetical protein GAM52_22395 [Salmonella enterica subsp. enterica serovar Enteritidis]|nr:hypothetical protein [Salmonella enterica subsp. enterica serovar Enteritidis]
MGTYAGIGHQIKEMNYVYVVTNEIWTENAVCPVSRGFILTAMSITGRTRNRWQQSGWMWLIMPLK